MKCNSVIKILSSNLSHNKQTLKSINLCQSTLTIGSSSGLMNYYDNHFVRPLSTSALCKNSDDGKKQAIAGSKLDHTKTYEWSILKQVEPTHFKSLNRKYTCILLNMSDLVSGHFDKFMYLWNNANLKIAVDGSANFLHKRNLIYTADVVSGDFDSIDPKLLDTLRNPTDKMQSLLLESAPKNDCKLPQVIETPNQAETDFTKAIRVSMSKRPEIDLFFALYHDDGTRIDHMFSAVHTLHLLRRDIMMMNIHSNTISWLLPPGSHTIHKPKGKAMCSLIPFTGPTQVKTRGLVYNISRSSPLSFGSLISTSNMCLPETQSVTVETNRDLLWSVDIEVPSGVPNTAN